jgi:DNA-binding transcriptional ArsR family regulator
MTKDMMSSERCAILLRVLGEEGRLRIIQTLCEGPLSVSEVADAVSLDIALASHHLRVLHRHGMVTTERQGKNIVYELSPELLQQRHGNRHLNLGCCRLEIPHA